MCRFTAIGCNKMPSKDNEVVLIVLMVVTKPEADVKQQKDQESSTQWKRIFGSKLNIIVKIESGNLHSEEIADFECSQTHTINRSSQ